jgi:hypothetical protein
MRDTLEERLATRLHAVGDSVADEPLAPPADLELRVQREQRRVRAARRWSAVAAAAAIVAVIGSVAVIRGTVGHGTVRIAASPTTLAAAPDALQPGTVMLSARGRFVISLDAAGHTNATMIEAEHGDIEYARATGDHRSLWYLSMKHGPDECGDVVRADIEGQSSEIVTQAVAFDVSPDGSRLALYGAGDLAHGQCRPVRDRAGGRVVVIDLASATSSSVAMDVTSLRWSPDNASVVAVRCSSFDCSFQRIDVPSALGAPLVAENGTRSILKSGSVPSESVEFGPGGLYVLSSSGPTDRVTRYDSGTLASPVTLFDGGRSWRIRQIVPTAAGLYVVAAAVPLAGSRPPAAGSVGLYRVVAGRLLPVRNLTSPGTLTPVAPLPAG